MILQHENVFRNTEDEREILRLKGLGFVEVKGSAPQKTEEPADEDLNKLTVKDLQAKAEAAGIEGAKNLKKQELIDVLEGE